MNVTIRGEQQDLRVYTITLQSEEEDKVYAFHCTGCGKYLQQIKGRVSKIYPFYEPSDQVATILTCPGCKRKYTFQTHNSYLSGKVRVILYNENPVNNFVCTDGDKKHLILEYTRHKVKTIIDNKNHLIPFSSNCSDSFCDKVYFFAEMI